MLNYVASDCFNPGFTFNAICDKLTENVIFFQFIFSSDFSNRISYFLLYHWSTNVLEGICYMAATAQSRRRGGGQATSAVKMEVT